MLDIQALTSGVLSFSKEDTSNVRPWNWEVSGLISWSANEGAVMLWESPSNTVLSPIRSVIDRILPHTKTQRHNGVNTAGILDIQIYFRDLFLDIQSWPNISAPLVNMIKEGCENVSALLILLTFYFKMSKKSNLSLDNKNLKWGEYHYEINVFL